MNCTTQHDEHRERQVQEQEQVGYYGQAGRVQTVQPRGQGLLLRHGRLKLVFRE